MSAAENPVSLVPPVSDWVHYLRERGLLAAEADPVAQPMADGVSARVVHVGELVCKQPYAQLQVASRWDADIDRVLAEGEALRRMPGIAPPFVHLDHDNYVLVQGYVPGENWKQILLSGQLSELSAATAGRLLRQIHDAPVDWIDGQERFEQLRVRPYLEYTARQEPRLQRGIQRVIDYLADHRTAVVHGDYSPKNILVRPATPESLVVIDWEVVHRGAPVFDLAFMLSHLRAKAAQHPARADDYRALEKVFLDTYGEHDESALQMVLGALLTARVCGQSQLAYLGADARKTLLHNGESLMNSH